MKVISRIERLTPEPKQLNEKPPENTDFVNLREEYH